jgi:hypothetical protein
VDPGSRAAVEYTVGWLSSGMYRLLYPLSVLVSTFMPCLTAADRMYGLNEEPTCSRLYTAMFTWQAIFLQ